MARREKPRSTTGIVARHHASCRAPDGDRCSCQPSYRAEVYDSRAGKKVRKTFPTLAAAKTWRGDAGVALRNGTLARPTQQPLRQAAKIWLDAATTGAVRTRSGDVYKPSALRGYRAALEQRVLPDLGDIRFSELRRADVQALADRLLAEGLDPSTIRNVLMPLRAIYRRALARGDVPVNPTTGLELPAVRGRRDHIVSADDAARLVEALPNDDRALWATALYAGLRRGELMALRWEDVDLEAGVLSVERSWDVKEGVVETKSRAGRRTVPIASVLRNSLANHKIQENPCHDLVFGRASGRPFNHSSVLRRAAAAWSDARLEPIGLHECRHTFASLMIAAGVNAKALSSYMGHSSITITLDRYGHLFPGNEDEAAGLLDAYLARARQTKRAKSRAPARRLNSKSASR